MTMIRREWRPDATKPELEKGSRIILTAMHVRQGQNKWHELPDPGSLPSNVLRRKKAIGRPPHQVRLHSFIYQPDGQVRRTWWWVIGLPGGSSPDPRFLASLGALYLAELGHCCAVDLLTAVVQVRRTYVTRRPYHLLAGRSGMAINYMLDIVPLVSSQVDAISSWRFKLVNWS
jgi:hypothetical protein